MNAKKCKQLRRWAESSTVGKPYTAYYAQKHVKPNPRFNPLDPLLGEPAFIEKIQIRLKPGCTRKMYKQAKALAR